MKKFKIDRTIIVEEEVALNDYIRFKVKELRKKRGYSQETFGKMIGLSRVSVTNFETGRHHLTTDKLYLVCVALRVKSSDILPF